MNLNERAELEAENDGYRNELQRAFAHSSATTPRRSERKKAAELVAAGKFVVLHCWAVYCRSTDAILGEESKIVSVGDTYEDAAGPVLNELARDNNDDSFYTVLSPVPATVAAPAPATTDECPF